MTWIEAYRRKLGMGRAEFAEAITRKLGGSGEKALTVPAGLIVILEEWPGAVTHPRLANLIARACGASPEERDMIVHECHRKRWHGVARAALDPEHPYRKFPAATTDKARESFRDAGKYMKQKREIVAIDRAGSVVKRLGSVEEAAYWVGRDKKTISERCRHLIKYEFAKHTLYTFRYADEWDAMTPTARAAEIRKAEEMCVKMGNFKASRAVVVLAQDGRELARYDSVKEAERGEKVTGQAIRHRCARKVAWEFGRNNDSTYRYADEWDRMTREERLEDIGAGTRRRAEG